MTIRRIVFIAYPGINDPRNCVKENGERIKGQLYATGKAKDTSTRRVEQYK